MGTKETPGEAGRRMANSVLNAAMEDRRLEQKKPPINHEALLVPGTLVAELFEQATGGPTTETGERNPNPPDTDIGTPEKRNALIKRVASKVADMFKAADSNRDGIITKQEIDGSDADIKLKNSREPGRLLRKDGSMRMQDVNDQIDAAANDLNTLLAPYKELTVDAALQVNKQLKASAEAAFFKKDSHSR